MKNIMAKFKIKGEIYELYAVNTPKSEKENIPYSECYRIYKNGRVFNTKYGKYFESMTAAESALLNELFYIG